MKRLVTTLIARDIRRHFGFLIDRGFVLDSIDYRPASFGNWTALLKGPECRINIHQDRFEILVSFSPIESTGPVGVGLRPLIYYLSNRNVFIDSFEGNLRRGKDAQMERLASLLREYLDRIIPLFGDAFAGYKTELLAVQTEYNDLMINRRLSRPVG